MTGGRIERDPMCYCKHRDSQHDVSDRRCCATNTDGQRCTCQTYTRMISEEEAKPLATDGEQNLPAKW